jgi:hypothetical protein
MAASPSWRGTGISPVVCLPLYTSGRGPGKGFLSAGVTRNRGMAILAMFARTTGETPVPRTEGLGGGVFCLRGRLRNGSSLTASSIPELNETSSTGSNELCPHPGSLKFETEEQRPEPDASNSAKAPLAKAEREDKLATVIF